MRVIGSAGENLGVMSLSAALSEAEKVGLDLIEISPGATPPIVKIMDFGKFQYSENKKQKAAKSKIKEVEVKSVQITIGTGEHDLELKAKKASEWIEEGNRIRIDLFLKGREKYLPEKFLKERLERITKFITAEFKVSEPARRSMKGRSMMVERM